ncbi:MAG: primosomal protein N' [Cyanobacteria bacterium P01_E01_bin.34]
MELSSQVLADGADVLLKLFPSDDGSKIDKGSDPDRLGAEERAREGGEKPVRWVEVLVDRPGNLDTYTYMLSPELGNVQPGDVLAVPFGSQVVSAIALKCLDTLPKQIESSQVRSVEDIVATGLLPSNLRSLLQRVARYYVTPLQQVVRTVLPPGILARAQRRICLDVRDFQAGLFESSLSDTSLSGPASSILELLQGQKRGDLSWRYVRQRVKQAAKGLRELQRLKLVRSYWKDGKPIAAKKQQAVTLCGGLPDEAELTARQAGVLAVLQRLGGEVWLSELVSAAKTTRGVVQALETKGQVTISLREKLRSPSIPEVSRDSSKSLTAAQATAVDAIVTAPACTMLLQGVTGSGKTEVYLQSIARRLQEQQSALVLVPEIGLTPQLADRFRARFGDRVLVYHGNLSTGERFDAWRLMLDGGPYVIIGTRSAVFVPISNLGLIVLDEEHDDSFKNDRSQPCYHARTVAQWRSEQEGCPLVLGTATPSLETFTSVVGDPKRHLVLPERIGAKPLPPVEVVDLRAELERGNRSVLSGTLRSALEDTVKSGQQAIFFLPRRGYSTFIQCRSCGLAMTCPHCDVSLTYHQVGYELRCHYCGYRTRKPNTCPSCYSAYFKEFGTGTQRVCDKLQGEFPELRILRFDRDTTRQKDGHRRILEQFRNGEADVLVGTQMLTKGIDIPDVTLVGVLAADGLLNMADFRAGERAFQLLTQVAGRAGRGDAPGRVILQTYLPDHPTIAYVQSYDYDTFAAMELEQRQELGYPPFQRLMCFRISSEEQAAAEAFSEKVANFLHDREFGDVLGPCPAQVERVAGRWRWQVLLKEPADLGWDLDTLATALLPLPQRTPTGVRLSIDVDPLRLL